MATLTVDGCYTDVVKGLYDSMPCLMSCSIELDGGITIEADEADFLDICGILDSYGIEYRD